MTENNLSPNIATAFSPLLGGKGLFSGLFMFTLIIIMPSYRKSIFNLKYYSSHRLHPHSLTLHQLF